MVFELADVIPWGRNFDEYAAMFALDVTERSRSILGCADGSASFNAQALQRNIKVVSVDPLYQFSVPQIRKRIAESAPQVAAQMRASAEEFVCTHFKSVDELVTARMQAMRTFLGDFGEGQDQGRYVPAQLPDLPFFDGTFDLALCSHFLFVHSEEQDLQFHLQALRELCRVAPEVRIFPLLELNGATSRHLPQVISALEASGCSAQIETVSYEFQKGCNKMLRVIAA